MEKAIDTRQVRTIYAIAARLGMTTNDAEDLHALVAGITGKNSVKSLTAAEAREVIDELNTRAGSTPALARKKQKHHEAIPGGVTEDQQRKAWKLMYELQKFDAKDYGSDVGGRLCGIIKRQFGMDVFPQQPFRLLTFEQGRELIEILKQYVTTAELKHLRKEAVHG